MAEQIEYKWTVDDSDVIDAANKFVQMIDMAAAESKDFGDAFQKALDTGSDDLKALAKDVQDFTKKQQASAVAAKKQEEAQRKLKDSIKGTIRELQIGGKSIGEWADGLRGAAAGLKTTTVAIGGTNKALKAFKIALAATGVGLILVALGSLVALLAKSQKAIDFVNATFARLTSAVNVIVDRLVIFGEGVVKLFQGEFSEAVDKFRGSVSGVVDELRRDDEVTKLLERDKVRLRERQRELNVEFAKSRATIEELRLAAEDETKSAGERQKALKEAIRLENEFGKQRIDLAEENLRIIATQNAMGNSLATDLDKQAEAEKALAEIREDVAGRQQADLTALQSLRREEAQRIAAMRAEYARFLDELNQRVSDARLNELTGIDRLLAEKELALQEVQNFVAEVKAAAAAAGQGLPAGFQESVQALIGQVESEFRKEAEKLRGNFSAIKPLDVLGGRDRDFKKAGADAIKAIEAGAESQYSLLEKVNIALFNTFGIDAAGREQIADSIRSITAFFISGIDAATQAQIAQQDLVLSAIENRIDETQRLLDIELQRQAAGRANNAAVLEQQLAEENAIREEAEAKRLELEKKAARQRLRAQQAEQISNYILSVTRLVASESFKGLPGIFTAAAGVALIFSLIKAARAQAQQFEVPQFREGAPYVEGPGTGTSDSIPALLSRGERVIPAALNMDIGKQVSNEALVRLFNIGKAVDGGAVPPFDLAPALARMLEAQREVNKMESTLNYKAMEGAYNRAAKASAGMMIEYWKSRPVEKVAPGGGRMLEWHEGGAIRRQEVKPK